MRTMTWEEIDKDWSETETHCREYVEQYKAERIARYCVGHNAREVAGRLGISHQTVFRALDRVAVHAAIGGPQGTTPAFDAGHRDIERLVKQYGPSKDEQASEEFVPYVEHYKEQGHTDAAAERMARAEWAGEVAIDHGAIKENTNKQNEKVNQILFPSDSRDSFEIDFKMHEARMKSFIRFLDEAKINHLRRKATCERVASLHEGWLEQYERILNFHPTLNKDV